MMFIVDVMLGKLAKWLRILGYDTLYDPASSDEDLFFKAHLEKRVLLTRDTELASRMNPKFKLYITAQTTPEQIREVIQEFNLDWESNIFTRCTICNTEVVSIDKSLIQQRVPEYIWHTCDQFVHCPACDKVYWPGSHIKHVREVLKDLKL